MAVCFPGPNIKFTDSGARWKEEEEEEEEIGGIKRTEDGQTDAKTSSLLIGVVDDNDNAESVKEKGEMESTSKDDLKKEAGFDDQPRDPQLSSTSQDLIHGVKAQQQQQQQQQLQQRQ